jgi:N-acetylmuramoyl-L-alanine amidase
MTALPSPDSALVTKVLPSPNLGTRKDGRRPDMLLLHYTGMKDAASAIQWLCNPIAEVSCHYVVMEDGRIFQLAPESARAWHAGRSSWKGETDINSSSIGIEIVNPGHEFGYVDFPDAQIESVTALCRDISSRWSIPPERVLAHSDVAPRRKQDPGEKFPWDRLHAAGVGHFTPPAPLTEARSFQLGDEGQPVRAVQAMFALYGYDIELTGDFDAQTEAVVRAFQRHFRPALVDGIADGSTLLTLRELIRTLPQAPVAGA